MDSNGLRLGIVCCATLLGLVGCGGNSRPPLMLSDSGAVDGSVPGPGSDAGASPGSDAGRPGPGSDAGGSSCATGAAGGTDLPPLAAGCTPRCSAATRMAFAMCTTGMCQEMALMADTTPAIPWTLNGMTPMMMLDCLQCVGYQQISCALDACPPEAMAFIACNPRVDADMCNGELMALNTCVGMGGPGNAMFSMCAGREVVRCFASGGGAAPAEGSEMGAGAGSALDQALIPWSELDPAMLASFRDALGR